MAMSRQNDFVEQFVEVIDLNELFRHVDEFEILREESSDQRNPDTLLRRKRKLAFRNRTVPVPLDLLHDFAEPGILILQHPYQEAGLVFLDPGGYATQNFGFR